MPNVTIGDLAEQTAPSEDDLVEIQQASDSAPKSVKLKHAVSAARPKVLTFQIGAGAGAGYAGRIAYGKACEIIRVEVISASESGTAQTVDFDLLAGLLADLGSSPPTSILGTDTVELSAASYKDVDLYLFDVELPDEGYLDFEILDVGTAGAEAIVKITAKDIVDEGT